MDDSPLAQASASLHGNDRRFVDYYEKESTTAEAYARSEGIKNAVYRSRRQYGLSVFSLEVADIGCNAGTQSLCWVNDGHTTRGLDISQDLVEIARRRLSAYGDRAVFVVGSATRLPWEDQCVDVCLLPELLEHVDDWETCLREAARILKPGGTLFLTTTNALCPVQQEFNLPLYSWYPKWAKRYFVRKAQTTSPALVNYATYPAFHWFTPYQLRKFLSPLGLVAFDRFDVMDVASKSGPARKAVTLIRSFSIMRFFAHVLTPSTILVAHKSGRPASA